jgi:hypothetical protein
MGRYSKATLEDLRRDQDVQCTFLVCDLRFACNAASIIRTFATLQSAPRRLVLYTATKTNADQHKLTPAQFAHTRNDWKVFAESTHNLLSKEERFAKARQREVAAFLALFFATLMGIWVAIFYRAIQTVAHGLVTLATFGLACYGIYLYVTSEELPSPSDSFKRFALSVLNRVYVLIFFFKIAPTIGSTDNVLFCFAQAIARPAP